ncbi:MAG: hypothetical protein KGP02_13550, partial [Burkholderiales bacterium]|nr:hypothetical protein [Burkholderiales bacterium]
MKMARLQQALSLLCVAAALAWCLWCWRTGWLQGAGWALAWLFPQAPVLALELMWAAWAAR